MRTTIDPEKRQEQKDQKALILKTRARKEKALTKSWEKIKKEVAVKELMRFISVEIDRHRKVGNDGVGVDAEGEIVRFTNEQRISMMDRASGLEEVENYLERRLKR